MRVLKIRFKQGTKESVVIKAQKQLGSAFLESGKDAEGYYIIYDSSKYCAGGF